MKTKNSEAVRCDVCGQFISWKSLADGLAIRYLETPDSDYSSETFVTLCQKHNDIYIDD